MSTSLGAFNQVSWYGVGDADECWIIATYWALVASGVMRREDLPTIAAFREASGKPDKKGPTGGSNKDLLLGIKTLVPGADAELFSGGLASFTRMLQRGFVASLSVLSSALPPYLQFGFQGTHQVAIFYQNGKFYLMNPLAKEGSPLVEIAAKDLERAANALERDGKLHALLIKSGKSGQSSPADGGPRVARPRDLPPPTLHEGYIDPWAAKRSLQTRRPKNGLKG